MATKPSKATVRKLYRKACEARAKAKTLYSAAGAMDAQVIQTLLAQGGAAYGLKLKDAFTNDDGSPKLTAFKPMGFDRWKIVDSEAPAIVAS